MSNPNGNAWNGGKTRVYMSGGFHDAPRIMMIVDKRYFETRDSYYLTHRQIRRLEQHFCGVVDCNCGSYTKAHMENF